MHKWICKKCCGKLIGFMDDFKAGKFGKMCDSGTLENCEHDWELDDGSISIAHGAKAFEIPDTVLDSMPTHKHMSDKKQREAELDREGRQYQKHMIER